MGLKMLRQILEEMAQRIYREWFVHFRFPGHENVKMVDSELGKIPEGWRVETVREMVARRKAGKVYRSKDVLDEGKVVVIDQSTDEFLGFHNEVPGHEASPERPIAIFGDHTCKMQLMTTHFSVGPNVIPFDTKKQISLQYLYYLIKSMITTKEYKRHWNELITNRVLLAEENIQLKFTDLIIVILESIRLKQEQNQTLRKTRDLLLPRLISGRLDVEDLEMVV